MIQDPYVKVVNVHYNGAVFAFPVGDVLVENGNTNQDTFGVVGSSPHATLAPLTKNSDF
jgi:hypothetical protein